VRATNAPVDLLIAYAYESRPERFISAPNWLSEAAFDINAKAPDRTAPYSRADIRGDGTGLTGLFDFDLAFTPDNLPPWPGVQNDNRQSLATALDQAVLKLETRRAPLQMLVIDAVESPSAD
jgi:hypothetical protein